jgi:hypothetical protein
MTQANTPAQTTPSAPTTPGLSGTAKAMLDAYAEQETDEGIDTATDTESAADYVDDTAFEGQADANDAGVVNADAPADGAQAQAAADTKPAEAKATGADVEEEYEIEGTDGIKSTIKVKFDAKMRKKLVHAAAQRQRFQSERDKAVASLKASEEKLNAYNKLNEAWTSSEDTVGKVKAVIQLLGGGEEAFAAAVKKEVETQKWYEKASPEERAAWERDQRHKQAEAALSSERKKLDAERKAAADKAKAAEDAQNETAVQSAFDSVRFSGKLKDEVLADRLDRQVFAASVESIQTAIADAKKAGSPLSASQLSILAKKTFQEHFKALQSLVKDQVKAGTAAAVDAAKTRAANQASTIVENSTQPSKVAATKAKLGSRDAAKAAILAAMRG